MVQSLRRDLDAHRFQPRVKLFAGVGSQGLGGQRQPGQRDAIFQPAGIQPRQCDAGQRIHCPARHCFFHAGARCPVKLVQRRLDLASGFQHEPQIDPGNHHVAGLADPQALVIANAAKDAFDFLGSPEGELALAQACIYLATAPKSNAAYNAYKASMAAAKQHGSLLPPKHILNAPTNLMKSEGYGSGYQYDHDQPDAFSGQDYFPEAMGRRTFYDPPDRGFEREIRKRLDYWAKLRRERQAAAGSNDQQDD